MKTLKKLFLTLAVVTMAVVCFAFGAGALEETGKCGENVYWEYNSTTKELVISGTGEMENYYYGGSPFCGSNIKSVVINSGVTSISEGAFRDCDSLTSVTIGNSVTSIGSGAFFDCDSLASITIPGSVTSIGSGAFGGCKKLTGVIIPDSVTNIGVGAFYCFWDYEEYSFTIENIAVIFCNKNSYAATYATEKGNPYVYIDGTDEESIFSGKFGNFNWKLDKRTGVFELKGSGDMIDFGWVEAPWYEYKAYITSIKLPEALTKIGSYAFKGLYRLKTVTIPSSVTNISGGAFEFCKSLTSVTIGNSVTTIDSHAFFCCDSLESVTIPDSVTTIGQETFYCCDSLSSVTIGNGVTNIDDYAFCDCYNLISVTIGNSVTNIGNGAFGSCKNLQSIIIPYSVIAISNDAFNGCNSLASVTFALNSRNQSNIKSTPCLSGANIKDIALPASVRYVGYKAFPKTIEKVIVYNPQCAFDTACGLSYKSTILGFKGSTAETFAEQIGAEFIDVETVHDHSYKTVEDTKATCKKEGVLLKRCTCGKEQSTNRAKLAHTNKTTTTKATLTKNGKTETKCTVCGKVSKTTTVYSPKTITLSATSYTYNGKTKTPSVTVKDSKGKELKKDTDYTVKYESGRKSTGKYSVTVTFKGKYSGTKKLYFTITPKTTSKVTATQTTTSVTLKWSKVTGATGYRVFQRVNGKWKTLANTTKLTYTIKKLKAGTNYTFAVRPYTVDGKDTILASTFTQLKTATKCKTPTLKVTSSKKGVASLSWTNVAGESGYQVYYSTQKDGEYKKVKSYKTDVVTASKSKLTSGKTYYFKIRAYKKTDSGTVYGAWSAVKSVKIK